VIITVGSKAQVNGVLFSVHGVVCEDC
jgi:hypothetical protein